MKITKRVLSLLLAAALLLSLAACAEKPAPEGSQGSGESQTPASSQGQSDPAQSDPAQTDPASTEPAVPDHPHGGHINVRICSKPQWMDPLKSTGIWRYIFTENVFESPLTRDADNNIAPAVCDYELSDDRLTLKLWVRDDVYFSNGDKVDIYDVEASFQRAFNLYNSVKKNVAPLVTSMTIDDKGVMTMTFDHYSENIMYYIAAYQPWIAVRPKEICEKYPDEPVPNENIEDLIGTGPYKYIDFEKDVQVTLGRVENYIPRMADKDRTGFAGTKYAYLDTMTFWYSGSAQSAMIAIMAGDYDVVEFMEEEYWPIAQAQGIAENVYDSNVGLAMYFNVDGSLDSDGNPINVTAKYPSLRKAIMAAIDYEQFLKIVADNQQNMTGGPFLSPLYADDIWTTCDYYGPTNMDVVNKYLAQAKAEGWDGVTPVKVVRENSREDIPTLWKDYLTKAGIPVEIELMEPAAASDFMTAGKPNNYDMMFSWPTYTFTPTKAPATFFSTYWAHDEYKNDLLDRMGVLDPESPEYIALAKEYTNYLIDACGFAYMGTLNWYWYAPETLHLEDSGLVRFFYNSWWEDPENHPMK